MLLNWLQRLMKELFPSKKSFDLISETSCCRYDPKQKKRKQKQNEGGELIFISSVIFQYVISMLEDPFCQILPEVNAKNIPSRNVGMFPALRSSPRSIAD